jgi:DNA-binding response OmpR family regulator
MTLVDRARYEAALVHLTTSEQLVLIDHLYRKGIPSLIACTGASDVLRIEAMKRGAGDHLLPPFDSTQVLGRLDTLRRAATKPNPRQPRWMLDEASGRFGVGPNVVWLSPAERKTVAVLIKNRKRPVPKPILKSTLADDNDVTDNAVGVAIHRLRTKLSALGVTIRARRGEGYVIEAQ